MSRRFTAAVVVAVLLALGVWVASAVIRDSRWVRVASLSDLQDSVVLHDVDTRSFLIGREGKVLAFSAVSPHSPHPGESFTYCPSSGQFEGPHGEKWDWQGRYVGGPAPRGLDRMDSKVENGEVFVDPDAIHRGPSRAGEALEADGPFCDKL